jgi:hypothetical protein
VSLLCREVTALRKTLASEGDAQRNFDLAEHQRHCVSPDRLCELVRRRVLFRPERSHSYEPLHAPRVFVVQDNVEVVEHRDAAVYSTVVEAPSYRFTMETVTDSRPGKGTSCSQYKGDATSWKVAGSSPEVTGFFFSIHLILLAARGPGVHSAYTRNEYQGRGIMFLGSRARPVPWADNLNAICEPIA